MRMHIGPSIFFSKIFFNLFLSELMSQKIKHPFSGNADKKYFKDSGLFIFGTEMRFDCSLASIIIFLILSILIFLTIVNYHLNFSKI